MFYSSRQRLKLGILIRNIFIIYILLLTTTTIKAQDTPVPKEKLNRLLDVFFYDYPRCTTTVHTQAIAIDTLLRAIESGKVLIELRTEERDLKVLETYAWENRFNNKEVIHNQELKRERKRGFKLGTIITGSGFVVLDVLILLAVLL